jgi:hypothetical protein
MRFRLIPLFVLFVAGGCSAGESSANGDVVQRDDELERAIAADATLREAVKDIESGHPWKATLALTPKLKDGKPATVLVAARAAAAWGGWTEVERLLGDAPWVDSAFSGEGEALLARAALDRDARDDAVRLAAAAVRRAPGPAERGARQVILARALDRSNDADSAAATYRAAARNLAAVSDWLLLRAAGSEQDADARAKDFGAVTLAAAKARVPWTEAQARERFGDIPGAIERYGALGARLTVLRLRFAAAGGDDARAAMKDSIIAFLRTAPGRDDTHQAVQILDDAKVSLTPADELAIARALANPGPLPRALSAFATAARAGLLTGSDRLQYALALSRSGRNRESLAQFDSIREPASLLGRAAYQRARVVMNSQGGAAAIPALRSVANRFPNDVENASAAL